MKNKLKHLAKFCCKPANELEFEAVKMAAEIGGVDLWDGVEYPLDTSFPVLWFDPDDCWIISARKDEEALISVLDFCNKLRMTEEEAEKLEFVFHLFNDDRVKFKWLENYGMIGEHMGAKALNGHYFKTNEDGTEVTLHKRD